MPSINDKIKDKALEQSIELQRLEAGEKKKVVKKIQALEKKVVAMFLNSDLWRGQKKQKIQSKLAILLKDTKLLVKSEYNSISLEQTALLESLAALIEKQATNTLNASLGIKYAQTQMTKAMISAISQTLIEGASSSEWWQRRGVAFQNKFKDTVRDGISKGLGSMEIAKNLAGDKRLRKKNGAFAASYRSAELLVRTSIHAVANQARVATFENNNDIIRAIEWVSTLDGKTTLICQALDGLIWDINTKKPIGHNKAYPGSSAHWGCRSAQVPVLKKDDGTIKGLSPETRASMDGQVSAKLDYEDWLKTKPEAFQKEVLGTKRLELWKDGKIDFSDLTNQNNKPLRLDRLKI
jgi:SPP1 gp7 family putative phage head morphogenesis protein